MPTPANRSKLLPARGTYAALEASLPDLLDGEMAFATDERVYYQVEDGALVSVNAHSSTTTEDVETIEGATRLGLRDVIPPEIPAGWTELANQREVNWWLHREVENVANRTTVVEKQQRDQAERIYDLENIEPPVIPEVDLSGYATTVYVNDADKVISDRLQIVEQDYTTTAELNAANSRISGNSKEIEGLQSGFDAALLAAQEGSENLTIELQSYAKKEDAATKDELAFVDGQYKLADENILKASQEADTALGELIAANTDAINGIEIPEIPGPDPRLPYALEQGVIQSGEKRKRKDAPLEEVQPQEVQELETLTLRDGEGNAMGDIAFECANGIGVRWSTLYEGTLRITGENLQKQVLDGNALLQKGIDANTAAIAAIDTSGDGAGGGADPSLPYALVTRETDSNTLPPKEKSASDGVSTTQILETITLQDASGNSLGDVHFESGSGIGVAMSTRHANTIYIQGGQLQNGVEANAKKIEELEAASDDLALVVVETDDASFGMDEETGQMAVLPSIQLKGGDGDKGRVWFQGGGGTGVSLDGDTIRITTTQMYDRVKANEAKLGKITPEGDEMGRLQARAGAGTSAFVVRNASVDNAETLTVNGNGDVTAKSFAGDGSQLTGVTALIDWDSLPELN